MVMELNRIICGDSLQTIKTFPDESIDCVITSPPYYQLRDYGWNGQWGLEKTYQEYLDKMIELMKELKRVLKQEGTMWINLGDTYMNNSSYCEKGRQGFNNDKNGMIYKSDEKIKQKSLMLIPHRFAIRCIDELGLILRNDIIWAKRNGMPESVTDRFSKKHEFIFFFVKQKKYYFDLDSIREQTVMKEKRTKRIVYTSSKEDISNKTNTFIPPNPKGKNPGEVSDFWEKSKYSDKITESKHRQGMHKERGSGIVEKRPFLPPQKEFVNVLRENFTIDEIVEKTGLKKSKVEHWFRYDEGGFAYPSKEDWELLDTELWKYELCTVVYENDEIGKGSAFGKNPGDVSDFWDVPTRPSKEKHYATFNYDLIDKPIIAGCPEGGIILDPFCGVGTTLARAIQLNRYAIGIDGNPEYCKVAEERINEELKQIRLL